MCTFKNIYLQFFLIKYYIIKNKILKIIIQKSIQVVFKNFKNNFKNLSII